MAKAERWVALLRGVNLGGKNRVPMKDLVRLVEGLGCADVATYIQSGNVVLSASAKVATALPKTLARAIEEELGVKSPVIVRSAKELRRVRDGNPFLERGESASACHVMFLADAPTKQAIATLDPARWPGDELAVRGREVYLFLPNGVGRSKITNALIDKKLGTTSTSRNWRTVETLVEMTSG